MSQSAINEVGPSLDYFISLSQQRRRDAEAECVGGLEIDDELECRRLLDRQISGLRALQYLSGINSELMIDRGQAGSIAHQAAGSGQCSRKVDRRNLVSRSQCDE